MWSASLDTGTSQPSHGAPGSELAALAGIIDARSLKHPARATLTCANASNASRIRAKRRLSREDMGQDPYRERVAMDSSTDRSSCRPSFPARRLTCVHSGDARGQEIG